MSEFKFKVGDKVRLNPSKCTQLDLNTFGSSGGFDKTYKIEDIKYNWAGDIINKFQGSNWHKEKWLKLVVLKNIVGGKVINTKTGQ